MKYFPLLIPVVLAFVLSSCSGSRQLSRYKKDLSGSWQLQKVVTEGAASPAKLKIFNEEDFNCFVGSSWAFNKGNDLGNYMIDKNQGECLAIRRDIRWSIYESKDQPDLLQFKRLDPQLNDMNEGDGFRFTILQLDRTSMKLSSDISQDGKPATLIFQFVRM
jgi:hypothetical protein